MKFSWLTLAMFLFSMHASAEVATDQEIRDSATGEAFPKEVSFTHDGKDYQLQCTGVATRKKFFIKVYSIASYLQKGAESKSGDKFQLFGQDDNAKQLTLKWVHEASPKQVQEAYQESFKNAFSDADYTRLKGDIDRFTQFFNGGAKKGDQQILRWLPGGYVEVILNGQRAGSLTNKDFAKGLWSVWFGQKSPVDRNNLISLM
jgi:Chalcone isomerase-like